MKRFNRMAMGVALAVALLAGGAWECASAPKSQCQNGSTKATHYDGKKAQYHCRNNEWVKDQ